MRVALYTPFVVQKNTGIARHILGLLGGLAAVDQETEYQCFWPSQVPWPEDLPDNFFPVLLGTAAGSPIRRVLSEQRWIQNAYLQRPFDVLHSPFGYLPARPPTPSVVTLHDLRMLRSPDSFSSLRGHFLRWTLPRSLRRADAVIAISEETRREMLALVPGVRAERVRVAYPGLDRRWFAPVGDAAIRDVRERLGLVGRFILAVSTREPHKNLPRLLEAVARARAVPGFGDLRFVLVGATFATGTSDDVASIIARLNLSDATQALGIVSDDDLSKVYAAASVLCFPSLYEGFGYPPLEAMAAGTPVVTSNVSCLPEVVGEAAELVDPFDIDSIAAGLRRVLTSEVRRSELIALGRERAARYSWESHARQVVRAYCEVASISRRLASR
jgi:glycosyltransferase involved in cell wall biosynthesis